MIYVYVMVGAAAFVFAASNIAVGVFAFRMGEESRTLSKVVLSMGPLQIVGHALIMIRVFSWDYVPAGTGLGLPSPFWGALGPSSLLVVITNVPLIFLIVRLGNSRRGETSGKRYAGVGKKDTKF